MTQLTRRKLAAFRTEIKYGLLSIAGLGGLWWLSQSGVLHGVQDALNSFVGDALALGLIGLGLGAFVSNAIVLISIPFSLIAVTFFLSRASAVDIAAFALVTGICGGLGKLLAYSLASGVAAQVESLSQSGLFRWFDRLTRQHPRWIPALVFVGIVGALPNDLVLLPMVLIRYPLRRMVLPLISAKIVHNLGLALIMVFVVHQTQDALTPSAKVDLTAGIIVLTVLMVFYQIEKARRDRTAAPEG